MKPTIPWMQQTFSEYNTKYFGGRLEFPEFKLRCPERGDWGYYEPNARYNRLTRKVTVITPGTICLDGSYSREEKDWIGTMLHEMIHMYVNTVMRLYPKDIHGEEFITIAEYINKDGWGISESNEVKETDKKVSGYESDERDIESRLIKPHVFCIINQPEDAENKLWGFRAEYNKLNQYIATAQKLKQYGAVTLDIYYCYSGNLSNLPSSPTDLKGVGANGYNQLIRRISKFINERLTKENFNLVKTITL